MRPSPVAVSAYQSLDGVAGSPNLEAIVRLQPLPIEQQAGQSFMALWFDPATSTWSSAGQVTVNGSPLVV